MKIEDFKKLTQTDFWAAAKAAGLTMREATILHMRSFPQAVVQVPSYQTIADRYGLTKQRIMQIEKIAKQKLNQLLTKEGNGLD